MGKYFVQYLVHSTGAPILIGLEIEKAGNLELIRNWKLAEEKLALKVTITGESGKTLLPDRHMRSRRQHGFNGAKFQKKYMSWFNIFRTRCRRIEWR